MPRPGVLEPPLDDLDPRAVEEALAAAVQAVAETVGADAAVVLLRVRSPDKLLVRAPVGLEPRCVLAVGEHCARGITPVTLRVLSQGHTLVSQTALEGVGTLSPILAAEGYRAWTVVPLELAGVLAGALHLVARTPALRVIDPDEIARITRPAAAFASLLRCLEVARAAEAEASIVSRFAQGVLAHVEIDTLFPELITLVARLCPCDAASVAVRRPEKGAFELVAVYGPSLPHGIHLGALVPEAETAISLAWQGELVVERDSATSSFPRSRLLAASGISSSLYVPVGEPERRGVLCVGGARVGAFGDEDVGLFRSLVPFLDLALRNAELIAKMRAAYRELEATQERLVLAERLRALGEVAAGFAHEVGNALAVVGSHADLICRKIPDPELAKLVGSCRDSIARAEASVSRVLDLARGGPEPAPPVERRRARLDAVALEAAALTSPRWSDRAERLGVRYELDTTRVLAVPEAAVDPGEARDALVNLILNALDALPRGGRIALATVPEDDLVVVSVDDDGPGIEIANRERVFEPFFTTKGSGHAGLGLSLVARLARRVGGSVRAVPSPLGGARFELRFPCRELGSGPHALPKRDVVAGSETKAPRSVSVLLVEDEPALRRALPQLLKMRGHQVTAVADVAGALEVLERGPAFEVVVTDLGLPGRSGWDLIDTVRARFPAVSIVVMSGWGALTDPALARERGVAAVLAKPATESELAFTIETLAGDGPGRA